LPLLRQTANPQGLPPRAARPNDCVGARHAVPFGGRDRPAWEMGTACRAPT
jgi:hypothetical protein